MFHAAVLIGTLFLVAACTQEPPPPPPVPHAPEDLSTWSIPEIVTPPTPEPEPVKAVEEKPAPGEKVLEFAPGTTYTVQVPLNWPLDVVLERGESVKNIVGGDRTPVETGQQQTPRIEVNKGGSGSGETLRQHLFVTATVPKLTAGFVITTDRRTYYLEVKTVPTSPVRTVRWKYPLDPVVAAVQKREPGLLPDPAMPKRYHVGYTVESSHKDAPAWLPRQVMDDGRKTYIVYPEVALFETVPMLRAIGPNGPQLINARQFLHVVIVDQLVARAELRVGIGERAETVTITRGQLCTIACPGDAACPVWPQAAPGLAQRSPPVPPPPPAPRGAQP